MDQIELSFLSVPADLLTFLISRVNKSRNVGFRQTQTTDTAINVTSYYVSRFWQSKTDQIMNRLLQIDFYGKIAITRF